jgi:hypothetical protein
MKQADLSGESGIKWARLRARKVHQIGGKVPENRAFS